MRLSNRSVLVVGFAGGIALVSVAILAVTVLVSSRTTLTLLAEKADLSVESTISLLWKDAEPVIAQSATVRRMLADGRIDQAGLTGMLPVLAGGAPFADAVGLLRPDGSYTAYVKPLNRTVQGSVANRADVMERLAALRAGAKPEWMPPALFDFDGPTRLVHAVPVVLGAEGRGLFFHAVTLSSLSASLRRNSGPNGQMPFILRDDDTVLAHPLLETPVTGTEDYWLPSRDELGDAVLAVYDQREPFEGPAVAGLAPEVEVSRVSVRDETKIILTRKVPVPGLGTVTVGTYFDARTEAAALRDLFQAIVVAVALVTVAVMLAWRIAVLIARPSRALAEAARSVINGDLSAVPAVPRSFLRELDDAATAFNAMVRDLRESERVRRLFGQVMPRAVAEEMIATPGGLEPRTASATVLFCDLAGFTEICEDMTPRDVVLMLNDYFDAIVAVIERHDGVVTQFQGDAVLAVFGLPIERPDHAACAIRAAREMLDLMAEREFGGRPLRMRIGINTGGLVAGNVGAANRMNYTVHGDAVNLAARLEQMNKDFGTDLLVSETSVALLGPSPAADIVLLPVGEVPVRGRKQPVRVFSRPGAGP